MNYRKQNKGARFKVLATHIMSGDQRFIYTGDDEKRALKIYEDYEKCPHHEVEFIKEA